MRFYIWFLVIISIILVAVGFLLSTVTRQSLVLSFGVFLASGIISWLVVSTFIRHRPVIAIIVIGICLTGSIFIGRFRFPLATIGAFSGTLIGLRQNKSITSKASASGKPHD